MNATGEGTGYPLQDVKQWQTSIPFVKEEFGT